MLCARPSGWLTLLLALEASSTAHAGAPSLLAPLQLKIQQGQLTASDGLGVVVAGMQLTLRVRGVGEVKGELRPAGERTGSDRAGAYQEHRFRWQPARKDVPSSTLVLRRNRETNAIVGLLEGPGAALAAEGGVELKLQLPDFSRGLGLQRVKPHWTAPVFVDDPGKLPASNLLLLWQREGKKGGYQVLVPLAGEGMIGEVGTGADGLRVSLSSNREGHRPRRVPIFALATGDDPYKLAPAAYRSGLAASGAWGRLREEKSFPEVFRSLGWCSWNTYYKEVTAEKVLGSVASLRKQKIPVGFVLVDDGWLSIKDDKLAGLEADKTRFPSGLGALARSIRAQGIPHVGVWRTLHGYWSGVDATLGKQYPLLLSSTGLRVSDPRAATAPSLEAGWARFLGGCGIDFVKVDNQSRTGKFCEGKLPVYTGATGIQRQLQESIQRHVRGKGERGCPLLNCMSMTLDNAFNWRYSNVARNSDDYEPDKRPLSKRHVYTNAYNALWTSAFAYPDFDMFQSHDRDAEFHAVARAVSGGPIYFTDAPGQERPDLLRRLALSSGKLLLLDGPGQVTRDLLLTDPASNPVALKISGRISRPGCAAGVIGAFNVNTGKRSVAGELRREDIEGLDDSGRASLAVYRRSSGAVHVLDGKRPSLAFNLPELRQELFTVARIDAGVAVLGLLDKYLGPAAVRSANRQGQSLRVQLEEPGELGVYLERPPAAVSVDGRTLAGGGFEFRKGLLRVPRQSFGEDGKAAEVVIQLAP